MNTKQPNVRPAGPAKEAPPDGLKAAYEIHTLAQLVYARLAGPAYGPPIVPPFYH